MFQKAETPITLAGAASSRAFFAPCFGGEPTDSLWVAHVDEQTRCIDLAHYPAADTSSARLVCQVMTRAADLGSAGLVLASYHRPGDAGPASAKRRSTQQLALAAEAMDVTVLDHLIFEGEDCTSMRRMGLL